MDWQKHVPQLSGDLCEIKADDPVWLDIDLMINEQNLVKVISGMCPSSKLSVIYFFSKHYLLQDLSL